MAQHRSRVRFASIPVAALVAGRLCGIAAAVYAQIGVLLNPTEGFGTGVFVAISVVSATVGSAIAGAFAALARGKIRYLIPCLLGAIGGVVVSVAEPLWVRGGEATLRISWRCSSERSAWGASGQ